MTDFRSKGHSPKPGSENFKCSILRKPLGAIAGPEPSGNPLVPPAVGGSSAPFWAGNLHPTPEEFVRATDMVAEVCFSNHFGLAGSATNSKPESSDFGCNTPDPVSPRLQLPCRADECFSNLWLKAKTSSDIVDLPRKSAEKMERVDFNRFVDAEMTPEKFHLILPKGGQFLQQSQSDYSDGRMDLHELDASKREYCNL